MATTEPQETNGVEQKPVRRRQTHGARLHLPFENRHKDAGEWAYDHRVGLSVMIICYLVLGIVFVGSKIILNDKPHLQGIYIDLQDLETLAEEKERLEREVEMKQLQANMDWSSVRNLTSNEALLNENLKDDRGTRTEALNASAREIAEGMESNRAAYEAGLAEAEAILDKGRAKSEDKTTEGQDSKFKGNVTVSFVLKDPVRTKRHLVVPAYRCEGGGEVVVAITVNRGGEVTAAKVVSGGDESMREAALDAAWKSLFNIDMSAPERHNGTITYLFIPQ
mgnify:FL=1